MDDIVVIPDKRMGKHPSFMIALAALVGVAVLLAFTRPAWHRLHLQCYLQNAAGLHAGAVVRVAGVTVGRVESVQIHTERRDHPVEVKMLLRTSYELRIPSDAVVTLEKGGAGEIFPEIEIKDATGPPVKDGGTLPSREMQ